MLYLQHAWRLSDEAVVARWLENPCDQHFRGETFFQHRPPIDPSSLTRWRKRIGEEGAEWLLTKTVEAGRASGTVDDASLSRVAVDTTVTEKNVAHPTNARLYDKARRQLVALADDAGVTLRQTCNRLAPRLALQAGRHAHARKFRRMRKALKKCRTIPATFAAALEPVACHCSVRDLRRQPDAIPEGPLREWVPDILVLEGRLLQQGPKSRDKICALHEPEVDCISKGKARKRYEFGTKVSLATTIDEGFVVGMRSLPGNPCDGHTLPEALEQVTILTGQPPRWPSWTADIVATACRRRRSRPAAPAAA